MVHAKRRTKANSNSNSSFHTLRAPAISHPSSHRTSPRTFDPFIRRIPCPIPAAHTLHQSAPLSPATLVMQPAAEALPRSRERAPRYKTSESGRLPSRLTRARHTHSLSAAAATATRLSTRCTHLYTYIHTPILFCNRQVSGVTLFLFFRSRCCSRPVVIHVHVMMKTLAMLQLLVLALVVSGYPQERLMPGESSRGFSHCCE